ncbi:MAG: DNA topoisomerase III, partial [Halomonas sp.]|nr:DNA topoisomerase III [Halomonas sp.]
TRLGSALIASLPEAVGRPERTALWEQRLGAIAERGDDPAPFLAALIEDLRGLLGAADAGRIRTSLAGAQGEQAPTPRGKTAKGGKKRAGPRRRSTATPRRRRPT